MQILVIIIKKLSRKKRKNTWTNPLPWQVEIRLRNTKPRGKDVVRSALKSNVFQKREEQICQGKESMH